MKKRYIMFVLCSLVIFCSGCEKEKKQDQAINHKTEAAMVSQANEIKEQKQFQNSAYISFTVTRDENKELRMSTFTYDLESKKLVKQSELEYYAQFPLAVYSKYDHKIYYTYRDREGCDQLWKMDLKTKKKECLTKTLFAVNSIIPIKNHLYLVAVQTTDNTSAMGFFEYKDGNLIRILEDTDAFVWRVNVNPDLEKILLDTYSNSEIYRNFEKDSSSSIIGENTLYTYNIKENKMEKVYRTKEVGQGCNMAIASDNTIYYQLGYLYCLQNGKAKKDFEFEHLNMKSIIYMNDKELYYSDGESKIVKYNRKTKEEEILYEVKEDMAMINNQILLY